ncbi:TIGR02281 family clan AA aspartic protease [Sphingomonas sp. ASV193]|uniref:retropepsin-like aspartic protease family protein n=1 Tax=Sphingomonas sp. ASV193 TaxID=3144405 RepID=UPI0032E85864
MIRLALGIVAVCAIVAAFLPHDLPASRPTTGDTVMSVDSRDESGSPDTGGGGGRELVLDRDSRGQFHLTAQVNGQDADFLVDTGADHVVLSLEEARRLNIYIDENQMQPIMQTAAGVGYGMPVTIDRLTIAGRELDQVHAIVARDVGMNLLGQTALAQIGKVEIADDRMTLH